MPQDSAREVLEVLWYHEIAPAKHGQGLGGAHQGDAGAGTGAEVDVARRAGGGEQGDDVAVQRGHDLDPADGLLHGEHLGGVEHGFELGERVARGLLVEDRLFGVGGGVARG